MSWCWFAYRNERPTDAKASAALRTPAGDGAGFLAAWDASESEPEGAARIDARAVDPDGEQAWISLVWAPGGVSLLFDDVAVSHAIRSVLAMVAPDALSTLTQGDDRFVGAVTVVHDDGGGRVGHDPFGAIFPARVLAVEAGLFGHMPPPAGPVTQRYGANNPWPWDRFS